VTTIGYPDALFLFDLVGRGPGPGGDLRAAAWEAAVSAVDDLAIDPSQVGVVVADEDRDLLAGAAARGWLRAVPAGAAGADTFELARGDAFGRRLAELEVPVAHVALSWNPGRAPEDKKAEAMELARLAAWLHETDRKLLIDLEVPALPADLDHVDGDRARFRTEVHPGLVRRAAQEIRDLGIEADLWGLDPTGTPDEVAALAALVLEAGREDVAILVADDADDGVVRRVAGTTGYRGVVAGRSIWTEPLAALGAGRASREGTVRSMAEGFRRRLEASDPTAQG
jgi:myo-inositol catabolism protein IolC